MLNYMRRVFLFLLLLPLVLTCARSVKLSDIEPIAQKSIPPSSDILYKRADFAKGWKFIVIHHSGTNEGNAKSFDKYHTDMGYGGLAYHFVIGNGHGSKDGEVETGFRWTKQMAGTHSTIHSWYHNIFGIGICLVGDFTKKVPSKKQMEALTTLVKELMKQYQIPVENVIGHKDVPFGDIEWDAESIKVTPIPGKFEKDSCPGKAFPWEKLRAMLGEKSL